MPRAAPPEMMTPDEFMRRVPVPPGGNTTWAAMYADHLRGIIKRRAHREPRNLQTTLGPSELGEVCDRQVVGKFAGEPITWHGMDPWPSIIGTAVHAKLAEYFAYENVIDGFQHWLAEQRVTPHPAHPGTADLYDTTTFTVIDWKILGPTSMAKIMSADGPPRRYVVQMLLYARGYQLAGYRVDRVVLAALPRAAPTLEGMYAWEHILTPADDMLISQVLAETAIRWRLAQGVLARQIAIEEIPITPTSDNCQFCPFYRPQAAREDVPGCPGHSPVVPLVR